MRAFHSSGATLQVKAAPSNHSDAQWQASLAWAFVSWRPSDDWLIRAGKLRLPFMLNTENADVGATYDFVRLPQEVYSIAPTTDVVGLSISKTWFGETFDWTAEAYSGKASTYWRYYGRDRTIDNARSAGSWFLPIDMKKLGAGAHRAQHGAHRSRRLPRGRSLAARRKDGQRLQLRRLPAAAGGARRNGDAAAELLQPGRE